MPRDHFSARLENADRLRRKFGRMQAGVREDVSRETKRGLVNIETGAKRRAPVDRGPLRNSITHEMDADQLGGVAGTNSEYGPPVEFGSRPHMPPVQPLIDWRSEEHTSELQSRENLVCRLLLEKKKQPK